MALTEDEQKLLDELTTKSKEPDPANDREIEIFDGEKGARIPFSHGAKWLRDNFGIGDEPDPPAGAGAGDGGGQGDGGQKNRGGGGQGRAKQQPAAPPAGGYFGRRAGAGGGTH
ncbi:MAG TPA: hypothetical protein VGH54_28250 [Mycobacterium sp.]|jgi:hypothetical protein|uniref:hypothetical protein n=1 Tax=Mycobacterium sp. TaxID=1785 RepID=UPI002F42ECCB